ncbi:RICIN domain-containing protein [Natrinema marinum]|uniref:RICIN domain-containing protein n=1 Tax=Natrinema marinum TaxID=2961598 RepID=UPI0020C9328F|nr:RICIN domain-containing protein [Natrinema marinum]
MNHSRRSYLKAAAASAMIGAGSTSSFLGSVAAQSGGAHYGLDDGFADTSWLESENVQVIRVTEPTRSAVANAFQASGPRLVVFETSGTIDLGNENLAITEDKCWVAGQTAPSPGITFIKGAVQISANDCVVQHIRSRIGPGDGSIQGNDAFNTQDGTQNNVVDHVTASWGVDECLSVGYDTQNTTVINSLIYEGLWNPYGNEADHNYGSLIGDGASNVTLAGNVWAKCRGRLPRLKADTETVVVNNLTYFFDESANADSSATTSFVGNVYTGLTDTGDPILEGTPTAYHSDNVTADPALSGQSFAEVSSTGSPPLWPSGLSELPSSDVESHNLANAGARPADRTGNDQRIVQEIRDRAGNDRLDSPHDYWVGHHDEVGGYPQLPVNTHSLSVPDSGLRDWLAQWASAVENGGSAPGDGSGDDGSASGPIPTGTYEIVNVHSGQLLEVANASTADGANVQQWPANGHPTQQWYVEDLGNGEYHIQNENSGKLLEVAFAETTDGANVRQYAPTGSACQRWGIVDDGGQYALEAVHSGKVADVENWSTESGANVMQWPDTGGANQRWTFESV